MPKVSGGVPYSLRSNTPMASNPSTQPTTMPGSQQNDQPSGLTGSASTSPALPRV